MRFGIQRRGIYLTPTSEEDRTWMAEALDREEIWRAFGYSGPGQGGFLVSAEEDLPITAVIRRVSTQARVGFALAFPPGPQFPLYELAYAIPRRQNRDGFTALAAADALSHYLFDHLGLSEVAWRTRTTNLAARAVLRRLGYQERKLVRIHGTSYAVHRLPRAEWDARRVRLEVGERTHSYGIGGVFVILSEPPWTPRLPKLDPDDQQAKRTASPGERRRVGAIPSRPGPG